MATVKRPASSNKKKASKTESAKKKASKTESANRAKQQTKNERIQLIIKACENIVDDGQLVTYATVAEATGIKRRTLEHDHYSDIIARYRQEPKAVFQGDDNPEIERWRKEADFWKAKYEKANTALKVVQTVLVEKGIDGEGVKEILKRLGL